jgi:hypothetical protein
MLFVIHWTDEPQLKTKIPRAHQTQNNELQLACVLHILHKKHKYSPVNDTMTLLKHIDKTTLLIPHEQLHIQSCHRHKWLVPEQHIRKYNPMYQLIYNLHNTSHPTWLTDKYCNINMTKNQFHPNPTNCQST